MISDVLRVAGDYAIYAASGGEILLDVGGTGTNGVITINGNLNVLGVQTTIQSVDASIKDNIIILNNGETNTSPTGAITLTDDFGNNTAGLKIDRGNSGDNTVAAYLLFNDKAVLGDGTTSTQGVWTFGSGNDYGRYIEVEGIRTNGTKLNFLGADNPTAVLSVKGTTNYAFNVTDPDDIPNKEYIDNALLLGTSVTKRIQVGNSFVAIKDSSISALDPDYDVNDQIIIGVGTPTNVLMKLEASGVQVQSLNIVNSSIIANTATHDSIILTPMPNGVIQADGPFKIAQSTAPGVTSGYTNIYTNTPAGGGSGVYFESSTGNDELVSRRRSIVYGIIF